MNQVREKRDAPLSVKIRGSVREMLVEMSEAQDRSQARLIEDMIVSRYSNWKRRQK